MCGLLPVKDRARELVAVRGSEFPGVLGSRHTSRSVAVGEHLAEWFALLRFVSDERLRSGVSKLGVSPPDSKEKK